MAKARLAVDIGGTFTDVVLEDSEKYQYTTKILTTHTAPEMAVLRGIEEVLVKSGLAPTDCSSLIHGTTLATNALIERKGAKTALLVTQGHRDSLEMAQENRFEQYDINIDRPVPLVPRWLRLPVQERINAKGDILIPLAMSSVDILLPVLEQEEIESVAIGFLHAYANPIHEEQVAAYFAKRRPDLSVSLASQVAPEIREYERQSTTVANAYVRPLMEKYLRNLSSALGDKGFNCPLYLITSGGGLTTLDAACKFPVRLVESGPAGGAILAASLARQCQEPSLLSFDMGGTTAKICLIDDGKPQMARQFEVDRSYNFQKGSGLPLLIPVIEMVEIGAGGGSIAYIDELQRLQVGPSSAGSDPGPAAYDKGGACPTVTDADIALGKIIPDMFAGGKIKLNIQRAQKIIKEEIGDKAGLSAGRDAWAITEIVDENMANAARAHAVEGGKDISARAMIAFGGAAPLHAARLAEKLNIDRVIIPVGAGVGSAKGFLLAPASYEVARSFFMTLTEFSFDQAESIFSRLRNEAESILRPLVGTSPLVERRVCYMRYHGQGYELAVEVDRGVSRQSAKRHIQQAFMDKYQQLYGRIIPDMEVEILTWAVTLEEKPRTEKAIEQPIATRKMTPSFFQKVYDPIIKEFHSYGVIARHKLDQDSWIDGPALVTEEQTTIVITRNFRAEQNAAGHIILSRRPQATDG
ncbi:MAG: hydantoinase/oxoprolinase family protein [bacterium]